MACVTARIKIPTIKAKVEVPTVQAKVNLGLREMTPRAQLGLVRNSVETIDPNNILTVLEDLPDGSGIRIGVSGAVAPTPGDGVMVATPLVDPAGRPHPMMEAVTHFPQLYGYLALKELAPWTTKAAPSGAVAYVGIMSGRPSEAVSGLIIGSHNVGAGTQRQVMAQLSAGVWSALATGTPDAGQSGSVTVIGQGAGTQRQYAVIVLPWDRAGGGVVQRATVFGEHVRWEPDTVPHLVWGVFQPLAGPGGVIEFAPMAEVWPARLPGV